MASKWSILFIFSMVAVSIHSSTAQTTHVVGGADLGWVIPPGGAAAYATWASGETFSVGDILVFNFLTGYHDVAEVSKGAYDTCNVVESPISNSNTGPTSITLSSSGEHFYICTYTMHCALGMKLAINISTATKNSPTPQPIDTSPIPTPSALAPAPASASVLPKVHVSAPAPAPASVLPKVPLSARTSAPVPASAPSPSKTNTSFVVGDTLGWTVPPGGSIVYQTWAANKTFLVGDILVFNFFNGAHNVAQLKSKADYDSCNTSAVSTPITSSPAKITLTIPGEHFYVCTFTRHCSLGQKLAINVTGTPMLSALAPSSNSGTIAPSDDITPPSPSSASKVMVMALTISLMSILSALFY